MSNWQYDEEAQTWVRAKPMYYKGWKAAVEQWAYAYRLNWLGRFMGWWDERGLGK